MLVLAGSDSIAAGELRRRLEVLPNTLSRSHDILSHAGLIESRRVGKSVIYSVRYAHMTLLLQFLIEDCCGGTTEIYAPLTLRDIVLLCNCKEILGSTP